MNYPCFLTSFSYYPSLCVFVIYFRIYIWLYLLDHRMICSFFCLIFKLNFISNRGNHKFQWKQCWPLISTILWLACFLSLLATFFKIMTTIYREKKIRPICTILPGKQNWTVPTCQKFPEVLITTAFFPTQGNNILPFMIISMSCLSFLFLCTF